MVALLAVVVSWRSEVCWRRGGANLRSVGLCGGNDALGNIAVFVSAGVVWLTQSHWPDIIVAVGMAGLFLSSAFQILGRARRELALQHA